MKPFNIEEAKQGKPVCTRGGNPARIICFDANNSHYPIIALVNLNNQEEDPIAYTKEGKYTISETKHNKDLVMVSEKKQGWINFYRRAGRIMTGTYVYETEEMAKSNTRGVTGERDPDYIDTIRVEWEE